jgi:hypothetical protein
MIWTAQRRGHLEVILLILMVIPAVALIIDRTIFAIQRSLFPYQYGSRGVLHSMWRGLMHAAEGLKHFVFSAQPLDPAQQAALAAARSSQPPRIANTAP